MIAHSPGYPTDIDRQPDREREILREAERFMMWQLR